MPSKKKKYNARFPPARIKKMMQADEEVGKVAAVVPVMISRTLEIFVESLLKKASQVTRARNARTLTPAHLKASINSEQQFSFLREMVAAVPDINTSVDEEPLSASTEQTVQANVPYVRHNSTRRSNSRPGTNARSSSTGNRGRQRKFGGRDAPDRSISMCDDEDDADETDEDRDADDVEENDEDETSSCDNSLPPAACPAGGQSLSVTGSTPAPTPLIRSVAHVIDDDYDAV